MTSDRLRKMFEGDFANTCGEFFSLILMQGRVTPYSVLRREERTPMFMALHIRCMHNRCIHTHNVHFVPRISGEEIC